MEATVDFGFSVRRVELLALLAFPVLDLLHSFFLRLRPILWWVFGMVPCATGVAEWMPMKPPLTENLSMSVNAASHVTLRVFHPPS